MNGKNLRQAFLDRERIVGVKFQHNDYVRVIDGPYTGMNGSLVSLEAIESEPIFLVELEEGGDVEIRQSHLGFINHDS